MACRKPAATSSPATWRRPVNNPGRAGRYAALYAGRQRITRDEPILDLGIGCSGAVVLDSIAACRVIEAGTDGNAASDAWTVSPGERVNVLIALHGTTVLPITSFGSPRDISKRCIALYVDQPAAFADAVTHAIGGGLRIAIA